ncbi:hypothetical protein [Jannaschia donghaensis]|uniref:Uncharacterized protein n=1 Tax=Jannaschia donghaensis TaxID=420998 RepID=A0A0M6YNB3_9RHOB|nr:hypothetical protein [Jannaschia donghaensis]CTQ51420.1 hypothetical protein JDO7802_03459 [Jannaschia donghaensis]
MIEAERRADILGRMQLAAAQAAFWFVFMFVMVGSGAPLVDLGVWLGGGLIFGAVLCAVPPRIAPEALDLIRADFQKPEIAPPRHLAVLSPLLPLLGAVLAAWVLASDGNRLNAVLPLALFAGLAPLHTPLRWRMALRLIGVGLLVLGTVV